ncbi:MAG: aldo/keto reductase [Candidatus Bathyarchaeia archaeon]
MEKRRLGRTGHYSSIVTLGCMGIAFVNQAEADKILELAMSYGVNHFDFGPSYGESELRLRPWIKEYGDDMFLACKTTKRTKKSAAEELRRSLERTGAEYFDLYQFHALDEMDELRVALGPDGALEAMLEARENGIIKHIGITSHRPLILLEALKLFDFDTVMLPISFVLKKHYDPRSDYEPVLRLARQCDIGTIAIKVFAKKAYPTENIKPNSYYEPFEGDRDIEKCLNFVLSQNVTTVASPHDTKLIPTIFRAAERYRELTDIEQAEVIESAASLNPLFPESAFTDQLISWRKSRDDY